MCTPPVHSGLRGCGWGLAVRRAVPQIAPSGHFNGSNRLLVVQESKAHEANIATFELVPPFPARSPVISANYHSCITNPRDNGQREIAPRAPRSREIRGGEGGIHLRLSVLASCAEDIWTTGRRPDCDLLILQLVAVWLVRPYALPR